MKFFFFLLSTTIGWAQTYELINQDFPDVSYRGLSIINQNSFLVSGSKNTIGKTTDAGKTFTWIKPTIVENRDFRDIEAIDDKNYIALSIDSPSYILETKDGGKTWLKRFESNEKGIFLDAIAQSANDSKIVMVLGDPIEEGMPYLMVNQLKKKNADWEKVTTLFSHHVKLSNSKEAFFAASGSNLYFDKKQVLIVSGGAESNLYHYTERKKVAYSLPKGEGEYAGMNGLSYNADLNIGYLAGGDFTKPDYSTGNFMKFTMENSAIKFIPTKSQPMGYKTATAILDKNRVIICGYSGVEYSADAGETWSLITRESYNNCMVSTDNKTVYLVGNKGKIGRVSF